MAFDVYAEGGTDMLLSRTKLLEILDNLGDNLPSNLKHIRRDQQAQEPSRPRLGRDSAAVDKWKESIEAGPSHANEHWTQGVGSTEFEADWANLPPAITALPSLLKIKQLVMRNSTDKNKFRRSLPVLANGIDHCFMSRPIFRQILFDLDSECTEDAMFDPVERTGLLPPHPDPLTLTEALWESQFGVPRNLAWYSAPAESPAGVAGCRSVRFSPPNPTRLGLSRISIDSPTDIVHCAVAGTKRSLSLVGPASGLLYAVVQGSLLLVTWPGTDKNFDTWYRLSRSVQNNQFDHLDDLEDPAINVIRTGDVVYLPAGTVNIMVVLTHVSLVSRQMLNPTSKELDIVIRCCNRLMDTYVEQQSKGYSPFDEMEVERMDANLVLWTSLAKELGNKRASSVHASFPRAPSKNIKPNGATLQAFVRGLREIDKKIERYRALVHEEAKRHALTCTCSHNRPFETLDAVAKLSTKTANAAARADAVASGAEIVNETIEGPGWPLRHYMQTGVILKGKDRAPS